MFYKSLTLFVVVLSRKVVVLLRHLDRLKSPISILYYHIKGTVHPQQSGLKLPQGVGSGPNKCR